MKKGTAAILITIVCIVLLSFTACQKLKVSNIKANHHFKNANGMYREEQYKNAIDEYQKALELNPDLKIAYVYLGASYSALYKAGLPLPEDDENFNKKKEENSQLKAKIEENKVFIDEFEKNQEIMARIKTLDEKEAQLKDAEEALESLPGYSSYKNRVTENRIAEKQYADNEKFIQEIEAKKDSDITEYEKMQDKKEANENLKTTIEENKIDIELFEKKQEYLDALKKIEDLKADITQAEESLKLEEGYNDYIAKVRENLDCERRIRANDAYTTKLVNNVEYGKNAVEYLLKAREEFPENEKIVNALGEIYDKRDNFEEAEKYFKMILEKSKDDPKAYYTLAQFYAKYQKYEQADDMYKQRIALDPSDPEGYLFYATYLRNRGKFDEAVEVHEKRIATFLDPQILEAYKEVDKINADLETVGKKNQYKENVQKNKLIDRKQRKEIVDKINEELKAFKSQKELEADLKVKKEEIDTMFKQAEEKVKEFDAEKKAKLAEAYYRVGYVLWAKSYQAGPDMMDPTIRRKVIEKGLASMDKALELNPDFPNPYSYKGLLWREKIKVDRANSAIYVQKNKEFNEIFIKMWKKQQQKKLYEKELTKDK